MFFSVTTNTVPYYILHCYGHSEKGDDADLPEQNQKHFLDDYWRQKQWEYISTKRKSNNEANSKGTQQA